MAHLNRATLIGYCGGDPRTHNGAQGLLANLNVGTTESWRDRASGERKEQTEWHRIVAYRQKAEYVAKYLKKGMQVYIEGKMRTRTWTDDRGVERKTTEIVLSEVQILDKRQPGSAATQHGDNASSSYGAAPASAEPDQIPPSWSEADGEDGIPV